MLRLLLLLSLMVITCNLSAQGSAEHIFKIRYAVLINDFLPDGSKQVTNDNIEQFRKQYERLQAGMKEIEMFKFGGPGPETEIFDFKDLKSLEKAGQIIELEKILKKHSYNMKVFLGRNHEYGIGKEECLKTYSNLRQCILRKDNNAALTFWRELFHFYPKFKLAYFKGDFLINSKIKESEGNIRETNIDTLLLLYDQMIKYTYNDEKYGSGYSIGKKGSYLFKYRKETNLKEAYKLLKESIEIQDVNSLYNIVKDFFDASSTMLSEKKIEPDEFVENYLVSIHVLKGSTKKYSELIEKEKNKPEPKTKKIENWEKFITNNTIVSDYINKRFASTEPAKCEYLIPAFKENFEENKTDTTWLEKVSGILYWKECKEDPFYRELIIQLYSIKQTANSAALIAALFLKERKYTEALKYFEEAYQKESDNDKKAEYFYNAAYILYIQNKYAESRTLALKALECRENFGKPNILIARLYAGSYNLCGNDDIEKAAVYWVAVDKLIQAKQIDPSCKNEADQLIIKYKKKFPDQEKAFMIPLYEGDIYQVNCWIQEKTIIRY